MTWDAVFVAFFVAHLVGDFLLQTEWQATTKHRGIGDPVGRRALISHGVSYTTAFLPALIWVGTEQGAIAAVGGALLVILPHVVIDDGRLVPLWLLHVKHNQPGQIAPALQLAVDQSFHVVCLLGLALLLAV
jgi:Protein of unknown function (DUF3307)